MLCLFAVFAFSCNEEMERLLTDDYPESGTEYTTGHVLMVVIDGASGIAVMRRTIHERLQLTAP